MKYNLKVKKILKCKKWLKTSKCCKSTIMDFQIPKFLEFALFNNHYQISKNEGHQNLKLPKLPKTAWFLQKLVLKFQLNACNRCHDLLIISMNLSDIAILNIKGSDYSLISKNEAINVMQIADLTEKTGT